MGILTDPTLMQKSRLAKNCIKHTRKICILLYLVGLIYFGFLAHTDFNHATYLSENALSPGLVYSEIKQDSARYAQSLLEELSKERETHKAGIPYAWIMAKMKQIGLETHTHNFTVHYPFGGGKTFTGKNVYGILRAPRIGSTEGIIFSTPYRPPNSVHTEITASVPILLAFADFARRKNYWAKDIIFLVTDQEQLGIHAWLEAYFKGGLDGENGILNAGTLAARAGALQAAINLEIQDFDAQYLDVKIEGLNGQLPNLDLFNLVQRLAVRESLSSGYKQTKKKKKSIHQQTLTDNMKHLLSMIVAQSNGVPTGNHGLFHRFRVESLTLEAVKRESSNNHNKMLGAISLLKTIEGISRSLNNLLERFHQSFFFYILVANDRFISIGDFMPCLILMTGSLYIKAFLIWMSIEREPSIEDDEKQKNENEDDEKKTMWQYGDLNLPFDYIAKVAGVATFFGTLAFYIPQSKEISDYFATNGLSTQITVAILITSISILGFFVPVFVNFTKNSFELLHVASLLYLGSALTVIGLLNFSLGFLLSIAAVPMAIYISFEHKKIKRSISIIYTFLLHPLLITYGVVFVLTLFSFKELNLTDILIRAATATADALTYSIVDWMIYGNWLFAVNTLVLYPAWILFWIISLSKLPVVKLKEE
ncbi:glycosylphosphatidylinositol anchor attachment 1 protein [Condylostylus longicornis]|uniref:glycosylphosphatidylinositol anchor attachment 1 protein n=1 Tax=Condylostylus longicornis TaxID=2530218 RepID=UPI00244E4D77|nr:glycosylphosphatidylinositol anchor attachment 1 protein [Condylostylus longicornis]XP_055370811.1 glycosylphosphatidylinositol anchor attachment 1 protein [Condylostylus longicornis]